MHVDAKMPLHFELSYFVPIGTINITHPAPHPPSASGKEVYFVAVLVRNRVSILAILASNRV